MRVRVAVVAVQQHDPCESDVGERPADVAQQFDEGIEADVDHACRAPMVVRDPEGYRAAPTSASSSGAARFATSIGM